MQHGCNDVDYSEVLTNVHGDVDGVLVLWEHEASLALDQEVEVCHVVTLEVDVLVLRVLRRFEQRTDPRNESR